MTQKTNQFNMTTQRYTEEEIKNEELDLLFIEIDKLLDDLNFNILKIKLQKCEETIKNG